MKSMRLWGRLALAGLGLLCAACQAVSPLPSSAGRPAAAPTAHAAVRILDLDRAVLSPTATEIRLPTAAPTQPPTPTAAPTGAVPPNVDAATTAPTASAPACRNQAEFVRHLSVALNTALNANTAFGKVWRIRNTGDCTWTQAYQLVFDHGETMSGPAALFLPGDTPPGQTIDLRVGLLAPAEPGAYGGYWLLQAPDGQRFGTGARGEQPLAVQILVRDPNALRPFNFSCG